MATDDEYISDEEAAELVGVTVEKLRANYADIAEALDCDVCRAYADEVKNHGHG